MGRIPCLSGYSIQIVELESLAVLRQTLKWSSLQQIWKTHAARHTGVHANPGFWLRFSPGVTFFRRNHGFTFQDRLSVRPHLHRLRPGDQAVRVDDFPANESFVSTNEIASGTGDFFL